MPLWPLLNSKADITNQPQPSFLLSLDGPSGTFRASGSHYQLPGVGKGVETYFLSFILFIESPSFLLQGGINKAYKMTKIFRHAVLYLHNIVSKYHLSAFRRQVVYHSPLTLSSCLTSGPCCTPVAAQLQQGLGQFCPLCALLIRPKGSQNLYSQRRICD